MKQVIDAHTGEPKIPTAENDYAHDLAVEAFFYGEDDDRQCAFCRCRLEVESATSGSGWRTTHRITHTRVKPGETPRVVAIECRNCNPDGHIAICWVRQGYEQQVNEFV